MKQLLKRIKDNVTEVYLGLLLFVAIPVLVAFYLDWRAGVSVSVLLQAAVIVLSIVRSK